MKVIARGTLSLSGEVLQSSQVQSLTNYLFFSKTPVFMQDIFIIIDTKPDLIGR